SWPGVGHGGRADVDRARHGPDRAAPLTGHPGVLVLREARPGMAGRRSTVVDGDQAAVALSIRVGGPRVGRGPAALVGAYGRRPGDPWRACPGAALQPAGARAIPLRSG